MTNNLKASKPDALTVSEIFTPEKASDLKLPLFMESVSAGFPSPADDYLEGRLDLNDHLIRNPAASFFVRVQGDSMINAGIHSGDILLVDRSLEAKDGSVVIAVVDGELTVKRIKKSGKRLFLLPENKNYKPIEIRSESGFEVWGVVTTVIHSLL